MRIIYVAAAVGVLTAGVSHAQYQDPQTRLDELIKQEQQEENLQHQNEMMRLEIEHHDLEMQLRYRRMSDGQLMYELTHYCTNGSPSCTSPPPRALVQEAANRGLIQLTRTEPTRPGQDCMIIGIGGGDGILDCQ